MPSSLDRPIWMALTTRQTEFAQTAGAVRRFHPDVGPFAASAEGTTESLAALAELVPEGETVVLQQQSAISPPPGFIVRRVTATVQMVAHRIEGPSAPLPFEELTDNDNSDALALANLTRPGPFAERTRQLGRFVGIRNRGKLVAMAGERFKLPQFTEVSGVCTHPDYRGKGYAAGLIREVARTILSRGETPFLHAFADNAAAIELYRRLGFTMRWEPVLMVLERI